MKTVLAAGAVVWRKHKGEVEVLLVHRPSYDDWAWPKGKLERGETLPACAVREVEEETGVRVILGQPLPTVRYRLKDGRRKENHYWAATVADDDVPGARARPAVKRAPTREVDEVRWVPARKAAQLLTYPHDRDALFTLLDDLAEEQLATHIFLLVRHARAKKRDAYTGKEKDRPLTAKQGRRQADRLVALLSAYGVDTLVSSPWQRCTATLTPYLEESGLQLATAKVLSERGHEKNPDGTRRLVKEIVGTGRVALCSHRPVLPTILSELAEQCPYRLRERLPQHDPWLQTAEVLVVHMSARRRSGLRVVALEAVRTPSS